MSSADRQRLATWVLTRCTPDYRRDSFIGDLLEQYEERGGWWYWRQALGAVRAHTLRRLVGAAETNVPAAQFIGDLVISIALGMFALLQLPIYADLLISSTRLVDSELSTIAVSVLIGAALIAAAAIVHEIRMRATITTGIVSRERRRAV